MEILLEGILHAVLAHGGIHAVVFGLIGALIFLGRHQAHMAQNLRRKAGVELPDGGSNHVHARNAQLLEDCQLIRRDILHRGIGVGVGIVGKIQLISEAHNQPCLGFGVFL